MARRCVCWRVVVVVGVATASCLTVSSRTPARVTAASCVSSMGRRILTAARMSTGRGGGGARCRARCGSTCRRLRRSCRGARSLVRARRQ
eukprot:7390085-Prymnesium_polylepis.2